MSAHWAFGHFHRANAWVGGVLFSIAVAGAVLGPLLTGVDPLALDFAARLVPPSATHWLGTDQFGRDVLSRLVYAASVSLGVSAAALAIAFAVGIPIGATAGYFSGWTDRIVSTVLDAVMAIPGLLLALTLMAALGGSASSVSLALGLANAPTVARVMRSTALALRGREYVDASQALGNSSWYTIVRHVIPNAVGPMTVLGSAIFAQAILTESALSFLGLGVPPPYPSWGGMLAEARAYLGLAPWLAVFPGVAIAITLFGINLLGDALRDRLDPRMQQS